MTVSLSRFFWDVRLVSLAVWKSRDGSLFFICCCTMHIVLLTSLYFRCPDQHELYPRLCYPIIF